MPLMMSIKSLAFLGISLSGIIFSRASIGEDYIVSAPATVYEYTNITAQNMDFDKAENMFIAHSGWYNDKLIHYYKFRMYTPMTYKGIIKEGSSAADVPIQKVYLVMDDDKIVGNPIIESHTADKNAYSDFMAVEIVTAPIDYSAEDFKSVGDILSSSAVVLSQSVSVINMPVVPTGSTLQDPHKKSNEKAPINPVSVWYKGVEVQTFVFEVTDQKLADLFSYTRTEDPADPAYSITVVDFASNIKVKSALLWHLNQFSHGVTTGENGGGPNPEGMRNIINLDRGDPGYSPLWQIFWVNELPINHEADQVSNPNDMEKEFQSIITPMFVNCPDIGKVGEENTRKKNTFEMSIDRSKETNWILGSHMSTIMKPDIPITFYSDGGGKKEELVTITTNSMGAFEYELQSSDIPDDATEIIVMLKTETIRTIPVVASYAFSYKKLVPIISSLLVAFVCLADYLA